MFYCQGEITLRTVNWGRDLVNPCGGEGSPVSTVKADRGCQFSLTVDRTNGKSTPTPTRLLTLPRTSAFWHWTPSCNVPAATRATVRLMGEAIFMSTFVSWQGGVLDPFLQCNTDLAFLWGGKASFFFFFRFPETVCVIRFKVDVKFLDEGFFLFGLDLFFQLRWSKWRRFLVNYRHFPVFWLPAEQMTTSKPFTRWPTWSTCGSPTSPSTTTSSSASAGASSTERPLK